MEIRSDSSRSAFKENTRRNCCRIASSSSRRTNRSTSMRSTVIIKNVVARQGRILGTSRGQRHAQSLVEKKPDRIASPCTITPPDKGTFPGFVRFGPTDPKHRTSRCVLSLLLLSEASDATMASGGLFSMVQVHGHCRFTNCRTPPSSLAVYAKVYNRIAPPVYKLLLS